MTQHASFNIPLSGEIIGAIVKEIQPDGGLLTEKTTRRYFKGKRVKGSKKHEIFREIGRVVTDRGIIPNGTIPEPLFPHSLFPELTALASNPRNVQLLQDFGSIVANGRHPLSSILPEPQLMKAFASGLADSMADQVVSFAIETWGEAWDLLAGQLRTPSVLLGSPRLPVVSCLRLATIDLALRVSAALWISNQPSPKEQTPLWAVPKGGSVYLKQLLARCGQRRPTREKMAQEVGVSKNAVSSWLDIGTRPHVENLDQIAEILAPRLSDTESETLKANLHRHYLLCSLGDRIAGIVGRENVIELATALVRFIRRSMHDADIITTYLPREVIEFGQATILALGVHADASQAPLIALEHHEEDPVWKSDLAIAHKPWHARLSSIARFAEGIERTDDRVHNELGIPQEVSSPVKDEMLRFAQTNFGAQPSSVDTTLTRIFADPKYRAGQQMLLAERALSQNDLVAGAKHFRRAAELQPHSAWFHFHLGTLLSELGHIEEAISECKIAAKLDETWEAPNVAIGSILYNSGDHQKARIHLEEMACGDDEPSILLATYLGIARLRCGDYRTGLEVLEYAISKDADNGFALMAAAHCAFMLGDSRKGLRLAKSAKLRGYTEVYESWDDGIYKAYKAGDLPWLDFNYQPPSPATPQ